MGRLNATASGALVLALAVAGCGGSGSNGSTSSTASSVASAAQGSSGQTGASASATTGATGVTGLPPGPAPKPVAPKEHEPVNSIKMSSPAFAEGAAISARYTCDGADVSPPLRWSAAPKGTAEIVLIVSAFEGTAPGGGELISWAVAGLRPTLRGIAAGRLPSGAVVGRNSFGQTRYTVCPPKGSPLQHYLVALYAVPHALAAQPGFAANALSKLAAHTADHSGLTGFSYKRK